MIAVIDEARVNFPSQRVRADRRKTTGTRMRPRNVQKALPTSNNLPQLAKGTSVKYKAAREKYRQILREAG